jgi:hypothetical protein
MTTGDDNSHVSHICGTKSSTTPLPDPSRLASNPPFPFMTPQLGDEVRFSGDAPPVWIFERPSLTNGSTEDKGPRLETRPPPQE